MSIPTLYAKSAALEVAGEEAVAADWGWSAKFSTEIKPRVLWSTVLFPSA